MKRRQIHGPGIYKASHRANDITYSDLETQNFDLLRPLAKSHRDPS